MKVVEEEKVSLSLIMSQVTDELKQAQDSMEELKAESIDSNDKLAERERESYP